jgi:hypothetical protein
MLTSMHSEVVMQNEPDSECSRAERRRFALGQEGAQRSTRRADVKPGVSLLVVSLRTWVVPDILQRDDWKSGESKPIFILPLVVFFERVNVDTFGLRHAKRSRLAGLDDAD